MANEDRLVDIIEVEFSKEAVFRGNAVTEKNPNMEDEEKKIFHWLMKVVHDNKICYAKIWHDDCIKLEWDFKSEEMYESDFAETKDAIKHLILAMAATGKMVIANENTRYTGVYFNF